MNPLNHRMSIDIDDDGRLNLWFSAYVSPDGEDEHWPLFVKALGYWCDVMGWTLEPCDDFCERSLVIFAGETDTSGDSEGESDEIPF